MTQTSNWETEQEAFWAGDFGHEYWQRNAASPNTLASTRGVFARMLARAGTIESAIEFGANIGLNLTALEELLPGAKLVGVELSAEAAQIARERVPRATIHTASMLSFEPAEKYDLVFTKGVLIHINPDALPRVYDLMYRTSRRYVMVCEYYSPTPTAIQYRGHSDRLFKRDFAGELMDRHADLQLVDYGFFYHRDAHFPQGDLNWFLMEKRG